MTVKFKPTQFGGIRQITGDHTMWSLADTYSKRGLTLSSFDPESKFITVLYGRDLADFARQVLNHAIPEDVLTISAKDMRDDPDKKASREKAEEALGNVIESPVRLIGQLHDWVKNRFIEHGRKDADGNPIYRLRMHRGSFNNIDQE